MDATDYSSEMQVFPVAFLIGMLIGLLLVVIILYVSKKDKTIKCRYDERQEIARGKAFKYAFGTLAVGTFLILFIPLFISEVSRQILQLLLLILLLLSLTVFVGYCIFHDAYFALNEKRPLITVILFAIFVFNAIIAILYLYSPLSSIKAPLFPYNYFNLACAIMFLVLFLLLFIKSKLDGYSSSTKGADEDEEP